MIMSVQVSKWKKKNIEDRDGREIGYGDKLNKEQWGFSHTENFSRL